MRIVYKQCPRCGSKDTVKIVYGMPTEELFNTDKYWIGGCCIEIGDDGEKISPDYHCKACGHEWNKKQAIHDWYSSIESLTVSIASFGGINGKIIIDFKNFNIQWEPILYMKDFVDKKNLNKHEIETILNTLIDSDFLNWKAKYGDENIIDGMQCEIEYIIKQKKKKISCLNEFPDKWIKFYDLLNSLVGVEAI